MLGGAALAIALWITLQVLGMGIGLAAVDTDDAGSLKNAGIGTGIWSLVAPLIAMFVGGLLAGRLAGARERKIGAMHGSVVWALALAVGLFVMLSMVSALVGAAAQAGGAVVGGAARAGAAVDTGDAMSALGVDADDLLAPINQRLERDGKPTVKARELNATVRAVAQRGLREGQLDRDTLTQELAKNTDLSQADAREIATQYGDRFQAMMSQAGERAKDVGLEAADKTGKALTIGGLMMLLSLGAAIAGGALGIRRREDLEDRSRDTTIPPRQTPYVPPTA